MSTNETKLFGTPKSGPSIKKAGFAGVWPPPANTPDWTGIGLKFGL